MESESNDSINKLSQKLRNNGYEIDGWEEDGDYGVDVILPLTDTFFFDGYLKQKEKLGGFSWEVLSDLVKIGI